jgi:Flp pilus assembly protein protease CpaA
MAAMAVEVSGTGRDARRAAVLACAVLGPIAAAPAWIATTAGVWGVAPLATWTGLVLVLLLAVGATTDLARGRILNATTYPAMLWALTINLAWGGVDPSIGLPTGSIGPTACLLGGLACLGMMLASFLTAGGGGGDVKLAVALGLLLGVERGLTAIAYTYLAAAGFALPYAGVLLLAARARGDDVDPRAWLRRRVRMGPFFAVGAIAAILEGGLA